MANVANGVKTLPKISIARVGRTNVITDRQTDRRQIDGRTTTYSERELILANVNMSSRSLKLMSN